MSYIPIENLTVILAEHNFVLFRSENKDSVTIKAGQAVASHFSGVGIILASSSLVCIGIAAKDIEVGFIGEVQTDVLLKLNDWTEGTGTMELAPLADYFVSESPGILSTNPPTVGIFLQKMGRSISPNTLRVGPGVTVLL